MGFLVPSYVSRGGTAVSTGSQTISLPASIQADDILILVIGTTGGQQPTADFGTWTYIASRNDGTGTLDPGASAFWHRYDGSTDPTLLIPDSGNHTYAEIFAFRNCERNASPVANATTFGTTSGSTTIRGKVITPSGLASGQTCIGFWYTEGGDDHGGSGAVGWVGIGTADDKQDLRSYQYTTGDDGSTFVASARLDDTSIAVGPTWTVTNSLEEARISFQLMAHEYSELTRSVTDGVGASDSVGRQADFLRALTDAIEASDATTRFFEGIRSATGSLGLSDAVVAVRELFRHATDTLTSSDAATRVLLKLRAVTDSLTLGEVISTANGLFRAVADAVSFSDVAVKSILKLRSVTDSLHLVDAITHYTVVGIKAAVVSTVKALTSILGRASAAAGITVEVARSTDISSTADIIEGTTLIEVNVDDATDIEVTVE